MNTDSSSESRRWDDNRINGITEKVIGAAFRVSNVLGCGFLEKVYENALAIELRKQGLRVQQQFPIPVFYEGIQVGDYFADLLVEECVVVELKACERVAEICHAQCLNYLKGTGLPLCLLMNFGKPHVEIKRLRL
jgi:GxxExxY protein